MKIIPGKLFSWIALFLHLLLLFQICIAQDDNNNNDNNEGNGDGPKKPPKEAEDCEGIFISYDFEGREKLYPFVKNVSAQAWSFKSTAMVVNTGTNELKSWRLYIGFQHEELLVSTEGGVVVNSGGFPVKSGKNGTILAGYPNTDLRTAVDTAGDLSKMEAEIKIKGTQFGVGTGSTPMPKTIRLANDGYQCRTPTAKGGTMHSCCRKDPKFKSKDNDKPRFLAKESGDLSITYDVISAFDSKYLAQVTLENNHPLGKLDQWNLTWDWMRHEFIYSMRGAYTHRRDSSDCIYGPHGQYYKDLDFSTVMNCQKRPIISDLPKDKENDEKVGKLPHCCKDGVLKPKRMNETESKAVFQLEVFKLPPDLNRTAIYPPQNWQIRGKLNGQYTCGQPIRIDTNQFPDDSGLPSTKSAIASWQVVCNITRPKPKQAQCCVTYSAYYADGAVPCSTCACGCSANAKCDANAPALALPPSALLVPFENRTDMAKAFAKLQKKSVPPRLPCPDNCGVSINWHIDTDYKTGWTARMTIFNWDTHQFQDWFTAIEMKKAISGFEKVHSFKGEKLAGKSSMIFMEGKSGLTYLLGKVNGSRPDKDPQVPGKQQSAITFNKKKTPNINIPDGAGFPSKVIFNGEECALPKEFPKRSSAHQSSAIGLLQAILVVVLTFLLATDSLKLN